MHLSGLDLLFWAAGLIGHVCLLLVLWIRGRARLFPMFTALITLNVLRTVLLFCIRLYGTRYAYFYTYWGLAVLDVVIQLFVVYELATKVFRPQEKWASYSQQGLVWWVLVSIFLAAALTSIPKPPTNLWAQVLFIKGSFFSSALLSELFVGMMILSVTEHLPWRTHVARISQGLGFYSLTTVLVESGITYFGLKSGTGVYQKLTHIRMIIYLGCVIFWIIMLWRQASTAREMTDQMRRELSAIQTAAAKTVEALRSRREV